jgi:transcriptional regulator with GAF, ATPase, and Fis domain
MEIGRFGCLPSDAKQSSKAGSPIRVKLDGPSRRTNLDTRHIVHKLEVHQIELRMQNEELCREREKSEQSLNMYAELYDFAPVAYVTFDTSGVIQKVNNCCTLLLEAGKDVLINSPLSRFIVDAHERVVFVDHLSSVVQKKVVLICSIKLKSADGTPIDALLQSVAVTGSNREISILTSIVDNTIRRQFEETLKKAHNQLEGIVQERTRELVREIDDRKKAEESLKCKNSEIKFLKDRLQAENVYLRQEVAQHFNFGEIIGQSEPLNKVFVQVEQVAPMNATVLLLGETGTGKGVVARAIHCGSSRKQRPLITINCASLPASLIESELFGRERGAFTGSDSRQVGRFELADGGTIFLDEVGE